MEGSLKRMSYINDYEKWVDKWPEMLAFFPFFDEIVS